MKVKKWMAGVLACCLMAGMSVSASAAVTAPTAEIETTITSKTTLEVGLNVTGAGFKSASTVLRYDSSVLELVDWSKETPNPIELKTIDTATKNPWDTYSIVPVKGATGSDLIASKPAMAFKNTAAGSNDAYVMLGADSYDTVDNPGRIATVRFQLVKDNATITELNATTLTAAQVGDTGTIISFSKEAKAEFTIGMTADNVVAYLLDTATTPVEMKGFSNKKYTAADAGYEVMTHSWTVPKEGKGVDSTVEGGLALTILDWDDSILDTVTLPEEKADAKTALEKMMTEGTLKAPLEGKAGYSFDCWLDYAKLGDDAAPFTSNNTSIATGDTYKKYRIDMENIPGSYPQNVTGLVIQAAYVAKTDDTFHSVADTSKSSLYRFDANKFYFTRYGAATNEDGKYSVTLAAERTALDGAYGVERARMPGLRVAMQPESSAYPIFSYQTVANSDVMTYEIVPTRDMITVTFEMVDTFGAIGWPSAGSRSGATDQTTLQMADIIKFGSANYIMEQAILNVNSKPSEWDSFVDVQAFKDAGFAGVEAGNLTDAKAAVKTMFAVGDTAVKSYSDLETALVAYK